MGLTLPNITPSITTLPLVRRYVRLKQAWSDTWQFARYLEPLDCTSSAAPEVPRARLAYHFGPNQKREDATTYSAETPFDLRNWYVQILTQRSGFAPQVIWTGIIVDEGVRMRSASAALGMQTLTAYGLEHLLDRETISTARVSEGVAGRGTGIPEGANELEIGWVPEFNRQAGRGERLFGNRSANKGADGVYLFSRSPNEWSNLQIAEYLLQYHTPANITWKIGGQTEMLDETFRIWNFNGQTALRAINQLIDRRKGAGWYLRVDEQNGDVYIWVFSIADQPIPFGSVTLPANGNRTTFTVPSTLPWSHLAGDIEFHHTANAQFDRFIIQGARIVVMANFSFQDGTLESMWSSTLQTEYVNQTDSDPEVNDQVRQAAKYDGIFTRIRVPTDWDWRAGDGDGGALVNVAPNVKDDGGVDFGAEATHWNVRRPFLRHTVLESQKEYTSSSIVDNNPDSTDPEFVPMYAIVRDAIASGDHVPTFQWHWVDRLTEGRDPDPFVRSAGVRPLDSETGFELTCNPQHYFAGDSSGTALFSDTNPTAVLPEFDWQELIIVAALETDQRQRIVVDNQADVAHDSVRTKVIEVPGASYWYIAPNCIVDIQQGLRTTVGISLSRDPDNPTCVRNDVEKLRAYAAFAQAWYGTQRQGVEIPIQQPGLWAPIGAMLVGISAIWGREPVRTPITARRINFRANGGAGETVLSTGWGDLDLEPEI